MAYSTADAFDFVSRLDRNGRLDEFPENKKQKVAAGPFLDKLHEHVIGLRTSCPTWNLYRVLLALGSLLASYASFAMGCAQLKDSILKNLITRFVFDARTNLTLSHTLRWVSLVVQHICFFLVTCSLVSTEKSFPTWMNLQGVMLHDYTTDDSHDCLPHTADQHEHLSVHSLVHLVSAYRHIAHCTMAQVRAVSVIHALMISAVLPRHWSLHSSSFTSRTSCRTPSTSSPWSS